MSKQHNPTTWRHTTMDSPLFTRPITMSDYDLAWWEEDEALDRAARQARDEFRKVESIIPSELLDFGY